MEPTPFDIGLMDEVQLLQLLERRALLGVTSHMKIFKQHNDWPPGGTLIEYNSQNSTGTMCLYGLSSSELPHREIKINGSFAQHVTGYNMYCDGNIPYSRSFLMSATEWDLLAEQCMEHIGKAIHRSHGIEHTLLNEVVSDGSPLETVFHVCDYLTMMALPQNHVDSELTFQPCFKPSQTFGAKDDFPANLKQFIRSNVEYFFLTFAIWDNHSELPVMLLPPKGTMPESHKIMKNPEYVQMQKFKHDSLRFRFANQHDSIQSKWNLLYRNVPS